MPVELKINYYVSDRSGRTPNQRRLANRMGTMLTNKVDSQPIFSANQPHNKGDTKAPRFPQRFIQPDTEPEYSFPKSVTAAHEVTTGKPNAPKEMVNHTTFIHGLEAYAAKYIVPAKMSNPEIANEPLAIIFDFPFLTNQSEIIPPVITVINIHNHGKLAANPMLLNEKLLASNK